MRATAIDMYLLVQGSRRLVKTHSGANGKADFREVPYYPGNIQPYAGPLLVWSSSGHFNLGGLRWL